MPQKPMSGSASLSVFVDVQFARGAKKPEVAHAREASKQTVFLKIYHPQKNKDGEPTQEKLDEVFDALLPIQIPNGNARCDLDALKSFPVPSLKDVVPEYTLFEIREKMRDGDLLDQVKMPVSIDADCVCQYNANVLALNEVCSVIAFQEALIVIHQRLSSGSIMIRCLDSTATDTLSDILRARKSLSDSCRERRVIELGIAESKALISLMLTTLEKKRDSGSAPPVPASSLSSAFLGGDTSGIVQELGSLVDDDSDATNTASDTESDEDSIHYVNPNNYPMTTEVIEEASRLSRKTDKVCAAGPIICSMNASKLKGLQAELGVEVTGKKRAAVTDFNRFIRDYHSCFFVSFNPDGAGCRCSGPGWKRRRCSGSGGVHLGVRHGSVVMKYMDAHDKV